jgi:hypothetical protein
MLGLARAEAAMLARSTLVLAGLVAGGVVTWILLGQVQPMWWSAGWDIGGGQLVLGMAVLVAAQLAAGRARRDAMADLYASFPASAGTRTSALLIGLAGAVPASLVLIGAAAVVIQMRGPIGAPSAATLAGGVLLVIAAGAVGAAIGARFPHPLAGVLGALALLASSGTTHVGSGAGIWLLPWAVFQAQGNQYIPGPLAGYPPASAHALELAGLAAAAGIAALAVTVTGARARGGLVTAGVLAVAVTCFAGAAEFQAIPSADLTRLVAASADPASAQRCIVVGPARYCLYPGFGRDLPELEAPVGGVLAHLPARPSLPLTIRQDALPSLDSTFTHGHPPAQVARWTAQLQRAPANASKPPAIYLSVGSWPAGGGQLANARFDVALAAADWAVRLPFPLGQLTSAQPCVPLDQAREAIAIWLAILATHGSPGDLQGDLSGPGAGPAVLVGATMVAAWNYPGTGASYLAGTLPQFTRAGYLLGSAMTRLPDSQVMRVLARAWPDWVSGHATDAELAAALGIRAPSVPALPAPGPGVRIVPGEPASPSPVCAG